MGLLNKTKTVFNSSQRRREAIFYFCLIIIPLVQFILLYIMVNFRSILFAFQTLDPATQEFHFSFKFFTTNLQAVGEQLFGYEGIGRVWWNSIKSYLLTLFVIIPLQIFVAFFVYKKLPLSGYFRIVLYLPSMVSGMLTIIGFKFFTERGITAIFPQIPSDLLIDPNKVFNTLLFYVAWTSLGGGLILMTGTMSRTSKELIEAAKIDGVNLWQEFRHITWPNLYSIISIQLYTGVVAIFSGGPPLYQFYSNNLPKGAENIQYIFFTLVINTKGNTLANYPKAALGGLVFTLVAAPLVFFLKHLFEKKDPNF